MNPFERTTALLATAFGVSLFAAHTQAQTTGALDRRTAKELSVLSRVLERRLAEARKSMAWAFAPDPTDAPASALSASADLPLQPLLESCQGEP
jgi:hypothetical protein